MTLDESSHRSSPFFTFGHGRSCGKRLLSEPSVLNSGPWPSLSHQSCSYCCFEWCNRWRERHCCGFSSIHDPKRDLGLPSTRKRLDSKGSLEQRQHFSGPGVRFGFLPSTAEIHRPIPRFSQYFCHRGGSFSDQLAGSLWICPCFERRGRRQQSRAENSV